MNVWQGHGTKIIGSVTALLGALTTITPDTLNSIFGAKGTAISTLIMGVLTVWRGFTNSAPPSPPPVSKVP